MAEQTPLFMDISNAYSGDELGLPYRDFVSEGVVGRTGLAPGAGDLVVNAATGNSVNIGAGDAWVLGDTNPSRQPCYRVHNDATVNKGISPDPAQPRYVLVVAQIVDEAFSGVGRLWRIDVIHGTPAAAPVVPAVPASALALANVLVPAAAASSAAYTITDRRKRAHVGTGQAWSGPLTRASLTAATTIPNAVATAVPFDTEQYDDRECHDLATPTQFILSEPGRYYCQATVVFGANSIGIRELQLRANGATSASADEDALAAAGVSHPVDTSDIYTVNPGAPVTVEAFAYQNSGGALSIAPTAGLTFMVIQKVG